MYGAFASCGTIPASDTSQEFEPYPVSIAPLRAYHEKRGSGDYSPLWAGQAAALDRLLNDRRREAVTVVVDILHPPGYRATNEIASPEPA
jgi:hypothetical protein